MVAVVGDATGVRKAVKPKSKPKKKSSTDWKAWLGFSAAAAALVIGWYGRETRRLFADHGIGYFLGIIGCVLLLILLVYPMRKRLKFLRFIGPVKNWFQIHMMMGVLTTLTILYHCNFTLGSLNSTLALLSMLLVAGSGLIGRFLYAKIHHGLFGRRRHLKDLLASVKLSANDAGGAAVFVPGLMQAVAKFDKQVLQPPGSLWQAMALPVRLRFTARRGYREVMELVSLQLELQGQNSAVVADHRPRLEAACRSYLRKHFQHVRSVATFVAYERLFALWHKVHLPFFGLLIVTMIVHIVAVHVYAT